MVASKCYRGKYCPRCSLRLVRRLHFVCLLLLDTLFVVLWRQVNDEFRDEPEIYTEFLDMVKKFEVKTQLGAPNNAD